MLKNTEAERSLHLIPALYFSPDSQLLSPHGVTSTLNAITSIVIKTGDTQRSVRLP